MPNIPYGSWPSPLSAKQVIDTSCSPVDLSIDRGRLYWLELRPQENSRLTLMSLINNAPVELTPSPFNVRSRVHEYGGGAYTTSGNQIFFCNAEDQRIYRLDPRVNLQQPQPITEPGPFRYADIQLDLNRNRLICVRESHAETSKNNPYPINQLVAIDIDTGEQNVLVSGADFYSSPKISPNHQALCWLSWSHPHMPWDAAELHQGQINSDGLIVNQQHVAGSDQESVFQPEWDMNGELVFVSDRSGWWNLYRHGGENIQCLYDAQMEFGRPQWVFGQRTYAISDQNQIICSHIHQGSWHLGQLIQRQLQPLGSDYSDIKSITMSGDQVWFVASYPNQADQIESIQLHTQQSKPLFPVTPHPHKDCFSNPTSIRFKTANQVEVQGFLYLPNNPDHAKEDYPEHILPPLIIKTHGGPSASATNRLDLGIQYWTSRGFALFDINYRGSTGFGREFREQLYDQWGIYDVEDCLYGAQHLVKQNLVHPQQLIIRGHSAGGYTTLCALMFHKQFNAGASLYGISDLKKLADECHKFESSYVDKMIGPQQQFPQRYRDRSPIYAQQKATCPTIFLQGLEDKVVPPNQSQLMADKLKQEGVPVAFIEFPGEGHGFRKTDNIIAALEAELSFYRRVFQLEDLENLPEIDIANLESTH
ncbi:MAG: peptidase [Moraxellaceae bacterium]|nr:MAG: peptidase [Moraxellaceae bacterium]